MKNLFSIYDKNNGNTYEKFVTRRLSQERLKKLADAEVEAKGLDKKLDPPAFMGYTYFPAVAIGMLFIMSMFFLKGGFAASYQERWYIFYIGIALVLYGVFCRAFIFIKNRKSRNNPVIDDFFSETESLSVQCDSELGVPKHAIEVDVIAAFVKKDKSGVEKILYQTTFPFKTFVEGDYICFADRMQVVSIKREYVKNVVKAEKRITFPDWNKSEAFDSEAYVEYEISKNGFGAYCIDSYYSVRLDIENEEYEIIIPNYDIKSFLEITQLEITK